MAAAGSAVGESGLLPGVQVDMVPACSLGKLPTGHWAGPWAGKISPRPQLRGVGTDHRAAAGSPAGTEVYSPTSRATDRCASATSLSG